MVAARTATAAPIRVCDDDLYCGEQWVCSCVAQMNEPAAGSAGLGSRKSTARPLNLKGTRMNKVTVKKTELLDKLKANRQDHRAVFLEALSGFRTEVIAALEERLEDARKGRRVNLRLGLIQPMDQTKEYDRAICMCEMSVDDTIELTEEAFGNYVMDDWAWKSGWLATNSAYSATARGMQTYET